MGLSTTDLSTGGSGLPKTLAPGNHLLKINSINLDDYSFIPGAKHLMMHVEGEPIDGFQGFLVDKDDESKGHYAGQIGRVKASQYAFADGETKTGIKIQRDRSIMMFMQNLCKTLGINDWFVAQDNLHDTIEDLIKAFNNTAPFKDIYLDFCIAGKEYVGKTGYTNYDLFLPKSDKGRYSFGEEAGGKVLTYDEKIHMVKAKTTEVNNFGDDDEDLSIPSKTSSDFSLD
ncbi:MAG: hypothetical protein NTY55_02715 [Flavobacteriia bacterium]|nr:hypothetical protein [Flavobacteriia bacterium]